MKPSKILATLGFAAFAQDTPVGYDDTPHLPDREWRVHDSKRPAPRVVGPAEGTAPPSDAIVLFDGSSLSAWMGQGGEARWHVLSDGSMEVNGSGTIETRESFGDIQLHIEWMSPGKIEGDSQGRGNSGVFLMGRYEIQILDSFENPTYADGSAAAMYGQRPPQVNSSRSPGQWQSYDILFRAPRFKDKQLASPAVVTVLHNGVVSHHAEDFIGSTTHRAVGTYAPHPAELPIALQDHNNPVRFRNIWVRRL